MGFVKHLRYKAGKKKRQTMRKDLGIMRKLGFTRGQKHYVYKRMHGRRKKS